MDKGVASLSEGDTDSDGDNDTQYAFLLPLIEKNDLNEVFLLFIPITTIVETKTKYGWEQRIRVACSRHPSPPFGNAFSFSDKRLGNYPKQI